MRHWKIAAAAALVATLAGSLVVAGWHSATQKSTVQGVTIAVTPGNLDAETGLWDFAVALDAPGQKLQDDLMASAVLVGDGRSVRPIWWEGARPGGSHRAGVLKFIALKPRPKQLELRIQRPEEPKPRVFRFAFGDWEA